MLNHPEKEPAYPDMHTATENLLAVIDLRLGQDTGGTTRLRHRRFQGMYDGEPTGISVFLVPAELETPNIYTTITLKDQNPNNGKEIVTYSFKRDSTGWLVPRKEFRNSDVYLPEVHDDNLPQDKRLSEVDRESILQSETDLAQVTPEELHSLELLLKSSTPDKWFESFIKQQRELLHGENQKRTVAKWIGRLIKK